jgi:hypothetical protein
MLRLTWEANLISRHLFKSIRTNGLLALRSISAGWAVLLIGSVLLTVAPRYLGIRPLNEGFALGELPYLPQTWTRIYWSLVGYLVACLVYAISGWIVAWSGRTNRIAMLLGYIASLLLWDLPWFRTLLVNSLGDARYRQSLAFYSVGLVMISMSILLGGCSSFPTNLKLALYPKVQLRLHRWRQL